jgi:exonuclease III
VFWNLNRKDLTKLVCDLTLANDLDVLVLNECAVSISDTLQALVRNVDRNFFVPVSSSAERFQCFCRNRSLNLIEVHKGFRTSIRKLEIASKTVLLGLVHGADIRNYDSAQRQALAQALADEIRFVKSQQSTNHVIMIGDFNMNPYDPGMNLAMGWNAMMTRECIAQGQRTFAGKAYDFFYNPMWSLFGDRTNGPAGTIYNTSSQGPFGWSMIDQVIINHSIADLLECVQILTDAGSVCLADSRGRPDSNKASDHFPIMVKLKGDLQ